MCAHALSAVVMSKKHISMLLAFLTGQCWQCLLGKGFWGRGDCSYFLLVLLECQESSHVLVICLLSVERA